MQEDCVKGGLFMFSAEGPKGNSIVLFVCFVVDFTEDACRAL